MKNFKNFKNFKTYNFKLLKVLFITFAFICTLNYFVNPYNIFDNRYLGFSLLKPEAKIQERYTKLIALKLNKNDIDTAFLGTSRADLALNKYYWENISRGGVERKILQWAGFSFMNI